MPSTRLLHALRFSARLPAPENMPTLRAFQRSEALAGMEWLSERWAEGPRPIAR